jgi:hypothetical protein
MKDLRMVRPVADRTSPRHAAGMLTRQRREANRIRGPYTSQRGPIMSRTAMVDPTPAMFDVQISCLVSLRSLAMYGIKGRTVNHTMNVTKKLHHAQ